MDRSLMKNLQNVTYLLGIYSVFDGVSLDKFVLPRLCERRRHVGKVEEDGMGKINGQRQTCSDRLKSVLLI